ncbi:MAG: antibiotic biosynthesis monooxygenase family protein [Flavobacteriaceae bacterium]|nr:antibiotic biosynthesis monooxygenase family protein [Flavobacteriaceae bacterium]
MIIRIVKMEFEPTQVEAFKQLFDRHCASIRAFSGCEHLKLLQDIHKSNCFFTYSYWQDEKALERYRTSALFGSVWSQTKVLFNAKPEAWSTSTQVELQ